MYKIYRNELGVVDAINHGVSGASIPLEDITHPLTIELREWEKNNGSLNLQPLTKEELLAIKYPGGLEQVKQIALERLIKQTEVTQEALTTGYSATERDTWDKKEKESADFLVSKDFTNAKYLKLEAAAAAGTNHLPTVTAVATVLAQRVLEKADYLRQTSVKISGDRARHSQKIAALTSIDLVLAYLTEIGA